MTIRATTAPGIEDVALEEGARLLRESGFVVDPAGAQAFGLSGIVSWALEPAVTVEAVLSADPLRAARALFHVTIHVAELEWDGYTLESLLAGVRRVDLDRMQRSASFRVSCTRTGEHDFHSPEVEREVGSILQERYGTAVDLEGYALHVKVDVVETRAFIGYQLTRRKGLDRRHHWIYHPRVTLRTPIAHAMLVLSGYTSRPGALHDPFCGSGTILLEAAGALRDRGIDPPQLSGSDLDVKAVRGASANLREADLSGVPVRHLDARDLDASLEKGSLDYIVTNPPFGIRLGRGSNFTTLYTEFLTSAVSLLREGGTLALLVGRRRGVFNRVLQGFPELQIEHVRIIEMGGVYAALFVVRRNVIDGPVKPD